MAKHLCAAPLLVLSVLYPCLTGASEADDAVELLRKSLECPVPPEIWNQDTQIRRTEIRNIYQGDSYELKVKIEFSYRMHELTSNKIFESGTYYEVQTAKFADLKRAFVYSVDQGWTKITPAVAVRVALECQPKLNCISRDTFRVAFLPPHDLTSSVNFEVCNEQAASDATAAIEELIKINNEIEASTYLESTYLDYETVMLCRDGGLLTVVDAAKADSDLAKINEHCFKGDSSIDRPSLREEAKKEASSQLRLLNEYYKDDTAGVNNYCRGSLSNIIAKSNRKGCR